MTSNHIDQLAEWWENAEEGTGKAGDVVIERDDSPNFGSPTYVVFTLGRDEYENLTYRRILSRAPKPAWHDAPAVIAHTKGWDRRRVFTRHEGASTNGNHIWSCGNLNYGSDDLIDPVPLIEAKVTDEARERVWRVIQKYTGEDDRHRPDYDAEIDGYITAALGLEAT